MFPVSSDAKEDDLESTELHLAATLRHLTACHHCGAPSIEETKGSVPHTPLPQDKQILLLLHENKQPRPV